MFEVLPAARAALSIVASKYYSCDPKSYTFQSSGSISGQANTARGRAKSSHYYGMSSSVGAELHPMAINFYGRAGVDFERSLKKSTTLLLLKMEVFLLCKTDLMNRLTLSDAQHVVSRVDRCQLSPSPDMRSAVAATIVGTFLFIIE